MTTQAEADLELEQVEQAMGTALTAFLSPCVGDLILLLLDRGVVPPPLEVLFEVADQMLMWNCRRTLH
jgi:hypothetical protein